MNILDWELYQELVIKTKPFIDLKLGLTKSDNTLALFFKLDESRLNLYIIKEEGIILSFDDDAIMYCDQQFNLKTISYSVLWKSVLQNSGFVETMTQKKTPCAGSIKCLRQNSDLLDRVFNIVFEHMLGV